MLRTVLGMFFQDSKLEVFIYGGTEIELPLTAIFFKKNSGLKYAMINENSWIILELVSLFSVTKSGTEI